MDPTHPTLSACLVQPETSHKQGVLSCH